MGLDPELDAGLFGRGLVEVGHVLHHRLERERLEARPPRARLQLGQAQQGAEAREQGVGLAERLGQRPRRVRIGRGLMQAVEPRPQAGERRAHVVRHRVAHAADLVHQPLDVGHGRVDDLGQGVELVAAARARQARGEVARHDPAAGRLDRADAPQRIEAQRRAERQARHEDRHPADHQGLHEDLGDLGELGDVAADEQQLAPGQAHHHRARALAIALGRRQGARRAVHLQIRPAGDGALPATRSPSRENRP